MSTSFSVRWLSLLVCVVAFFGLLARPTHAAAPTTKAPPLPTPTLVAKPVEGGDPVAPPLEAAPNSPLDSLDPFWPNTCGSVTGETDPEACCVSGYVFVNGINQPTAKVIVTSAHGSREAGRATANVDAYGISLSSPPLNATVGSVITVTAQYNDLVTYITHTIALSDRAPHIDLTLTPNISRLSLTPSGGQVLVDDGYGQGVAISQDGSAVAFASKAQGLVSNDSNALSDVFVYDRASRRLARVSVATSGVAGDGDSSSPAISATGRYIAFVSTSKNFSGVTASGTYNIFRYDLVAKQVALISRATNGGEGNGWSAGPSISADGRLVAFTSLANNLIDADTPQYWDVFVRDVTNGTTKRVSVNSSGIAADNGDFWMTAQISGNGQYVVFDSIATNLVAGDSNGKRDIFFHNRTTGETERVSRALNGAQPNGDSMGAQVSHDGRYILYQSNAANLVYSDTNNASDIFLYDRLGRTTVRLSKSIDGIQGNSGSAQPRLSADGHYVTFSSTATNLVAGDTNGIDDIFVYRRQTDGSMSPPLLWRLPVGYNGVGSNGLSLFSALSQDGRFLAFASHANNLVTSDSNNSSDVFLREIKP